MPVATTATTVVSGPAAGAGAQQQRQPPPPQQQQTQHTDTAGDDIWSAILGQVSTTKTVATRTILVCGDTGPDAAAVVDAIVGASSGDQHDSVDGSRPSTSDTTCGMSFSHFDVNDEENETVARVGVYHLANDPTFHRLLHLALTPAAAAETLVLILLDWARPWAFVETLNEWLRLLEAKVQDMSGSHAALVRDMKDTLELHIRSYREPDDAVSRVLGNTLPSSASNAPPSPDRRAGATAATAAAMLPLGPGVLCRSIGLNMVVVCYRSEVVSDLEKTFRDEHFDYIQQSLRTICLSYGAALLYVSLQRPETIANLRSYSLYRLFGAPSAALQNTVSGQGAAAASVSASAALGSSSASTSILSQSGRQPLGQSSNGGSNRPPVSGIFDFTVPVQYVEREALLLPAGWDSWGKIRVIRNGFACEVYAGTKEPDPKFAAMPTVHGPLGKLVPVYHSVIRDRTSKKTSNREVPDEPENDQDFLERQYALLQSFDDAPSANTGRPSVGGMATSATSGSPMAASRSQQGGLPNSATAASPFASDLGGASTSGTGASAAGAAVSGSSVSPSIGTGTVGSPSGSEVPPQPAPKDTGDSSPRRKSPLSMAPKTSQIASSKEALSDMSVKIAKLRVSRSWIGSLLSIAL
ncbi:dynein light intermediate chain-domain-containing protein [Entophlyctis helioformis]|nr:dynein light intermediate chain-domain-containing protein [Entophlyctis helioformis]